jgi:DNA-binding NtrC family response regulator
MALKNLLPGVVVGGVGWGHRGAAPAAAVQISPPLLSGVAAPTGNSGVESRVPNSFVPGQNATISFDIPLRDARDAFERAYFEYHLSRENGSMTRVAEKTGLERTHLYRKLKQLGVELGKNKSE